MQRAIDLQLHYVVDQPKVACTHTHGVIYNLPSGLKPGGR